MAATRTAQGVRRWGWWMASGVLLGAVIVDLIDGQPHKLATSIALFVACAIAAWFPAPRPVLAQSLILLAALAAVALLAYRLTVVGA